MILAVDVGGTKTLVAAFGPQGGIIKSRKIPTSPIYNEFITHLLELIQKDFWREDITLISIAIAGSINYTTGKVIRLGNLPWENVDVAHSLRHAFKIPVLIENDANIGGLSEAYELKKLPRHLLYITIGTGIGSGVITDGRINPSLAHSEAGHIMLEHQGVLQRWEDLCSGRAIVRDYQQIAAEIDDPAIWDDIASKFALGFLAILPVVQPDIVVIGGGVGTHFDKYAGKLKKRLRLHLPAMVPLPTIVQAVHPEEAVIYGCYKFATQNAA